MRYLFLSISFFVSLSASASAIDEVLAAAKQMQLSASPTWLALLHYKKETISRQLLSQADGADFFLSASGKTDPQAELEADLFALLQPAAINHAQCRFPARWFWLKQQLSIAASDYDVACPKLSAWLHIVAADKLTLVFPAMYLNSPGSMFGHTFIRFDRSDKSSLLAYTLNYAAKAAADDGIFSYAYKGISGGYNGVFATRPYYQTVQVYNNLENRDIWEYRLDYTQQEITQLLRHVWEVAGVEFDYFFFNENCAYRLLALLDAVKPEARLSSRESFPVYVIPVDTVRVLDEKGLIVARRFRPSLATQIEHNSERLSPLLNATALALADNEITLDEFKARVTDSQHRAVTLDQAYTLLQFRAQAETALASNILSERRNFAKSPEPQYQISRPEIGHDSVLAAIGGGEVRGKNSLRLQLRGSFHSLLDNPAGYVEGADITSFDTEFNWLTDESRLQLEKLTLFNIAALVPMKRWQKPVSWRFNMGLQRMPLNTAQSTLAWLTSGSAGGSVKLAGVIYFVLADVELNATRRYAKGYSTLLGASGGMVYPFGSGQLKLEYQAMSAFAGADIDRVRTSAGVNFNLSRSLALEFDYARSDFGGFEVDDWGVKINFYF